MTHKKENAQPVYLYLMAIDHMPLIEGHDRIGHEVFKVGITSSIYSRLSQIQTGCPWEVNLVGCWPIGERDLARKFEREFHEDNEGCRLNGEWFQGWVTGSLCDIQAMFARYWVDNRGFDGVIDYLHSLGIREESARDTVISIYGAMDGVQ